MSKTIPEKSKSAWHMVREINNLNAELRAAERALLEVYRVGARDGDVVEIHHEMMRIIHNWNQASLARNLRKD